MDRIPKMADMAITPTEIENVKILPQSTESSAPIYPYGLSLCLNDDTLDKLNMEDNCEVGDMVHFRCVAKVTSCSDHENMGKRIELQIVMMSAEGAEDDDDEEEAQPHKIKNPYDRK
jgi:hypothetical protein